MGWRRSFAVLKILTGYVLAVLIASGVCTLLFAASDAFRSHGAPQISDIFTILGIGVPTTALSAWPGFLMTLAGSRFTGQNGHCYYVICGIITSGLSVIFAAETFWGEGIYNLLASPAVYAGGAFGGLTYALFHRRFIVIDDT